MVFIGIIISHAPYFYFCISRSSSELDFGYENPFEYDSIMLLYDIDELNINASNRLS